MAGATAEIVPSACEPKPPISLGTQDIGRSNGPSRVFCWAMCLRQGSMSMANWTRSRAASGRPTKAS